MGGGGEPMPIPKFDSVNHILGYWATTNMILAPQVQSEESVGTRDDYNRYLSRLDEPYLKELAGNATVDVPLARPLLGLAMLLVLAGYWPDFAAAIRLAWRRQQASC